MNLYRQTLAADAVENGDGEEALEIADDDDSQWVQPDFSWKGKTQFYPDGTPWKRNGPQNLFDHVKKGGYYDGWEYPTDGYMPDTGRYNFGKQDRSLPLKPWYTKIYLMYQTHPEMWSYIFGFGFPGILLQFWAWWNYPRSHKELEERM